MAWRVGVGTRHQVAVSAIGAFAGMALALQGLDPTGSPVVDWVLLVAACVVAVHACTTAPWWALTALTMVATVLARPWWPFVIGVGALVLSLAIGSTKGGQTLERAFVAAAAIVVMSMSGELWRFGITSLINITVVVAVVGLGIWHRSSAARGVAWRTAAVVGGLGLLAVIGLALSGIASRDDLSEGNRDARAGLRFLEHGELELAQESFERAARSFDRADRDMNAPWAQLARLVPIAAQHRAAGADLSHSAAATTREIAEQLELVDLEALRVVEGRLDIDAVRALQAPMTELQEALEELESELVSARSPWLVSPVRRRLADLITEVGERRALGAKAVAALAAAPDLLGADAPRVYFVMFTTPAEARGQGGFMGNYAELTVDDGDIELTAFGRHTDLNEAIVRPAALERAPADWIGQYGQFGFRMGDDGTVGRSPWSNITMSPDFPSTAQVVSELYPKSGGHALDGVFSVDVYVMQALVGLVGPIDVEGAPYALTGENTAGFLLIDQYKQSDRPDANDTRLDLLETVARTTIDRLLGNSPDPIELGRAMAPFVEQRRLFGWSPVPAEQAVFAGAGMDGAPFAAIGAGEAGIVVTANNAGASKIDTFLHFDVETVGNQVRVTIANDAPEDGYPDYVIGNRIDLPRGTSRLWIAIQSDRPVTGAMLDGAPAELGGLAPVRGYAYGTFATLGPGSRATLTLFLEATADASPVTVVGRQATVIW